MLKVSKSTLNEVDVVTFMVDNSLEIGKQDKGIIEQLMEIETPKILLINKIDQLTKEEIDYLINKYKSMNMFEYIIPISAIQNKNIDLYLSALKELLPEGPQYYPDDMITDQPERMIIAEIVREKALNNLQEEIPHGIYVEVQEIKERADKNLLDVYVNLYCEKESHKGMIIGKNGKMLKKIGTEARNDIEKLMDTKVNLKIWVKVEKNWRDKADKVKYFGYKLS